MKEQYLYTLHKNEIKLDFIFLGGSGEIYRFNAPGPPHQNNTSWNIFWGPQSHRTVMSFVFSEPH